MAARDAHRNVVILGGGFAGAFSARYLRRVVPRDVSVELICDRNYFVFQPLLPEVAAGTINGVRGYCPSYRKNWGVTRRQDSPRTVSR